MHNIKDDIFMMKISCFQNVYYNRFKKRVRKILSSYAWKQEDMIETTKALDSNKKLEH